MKRIAIGAYTGISAESLGRATSGLQRSGAAPHFSLIQTSHTDDVVAAVNVQQFAGHPA
jgi:hypothetical protein